MQQFEAIIFDLDGTLWDSSHEIQKSWNTAVEQNGQVRGPIGYEELSNCLGLPMDEIGRRLFPDIDAQQQQKVMDACCELENEYLSEHGATLYPQVEATLQELQKQYQLYIVSNCQSGYIEAFLHAHKLEKYFKDIECWGNTGRFKGANNKLIMERNQVTKAIYVGDTQGDAQSAIDAKIPFIFCKYGFGTVQKFAYAIDTFADLLQLPCFKGND